MSGTGSGTAPRNRPGAHPTQDPAETVTLTVGGKPYTQWTEVRIERAIDRMSSKFDLAVVRRARVPKGEQADDLLPFTPAVLSIGRDRVLTGYVDSWVPQIGPTTHGARVAGRSKTCDLIDCMPDVPSGQFAGYQLAAIARSLAQPFGVEVIDQANATDPLADTTIWRAETCYQFLERLGRLSRVLLCDDEFGRLVLTRTGSTRARDRILQGGNVVLAFGTLSGARRFSTYVVKSQHSITTFDGAAVGTGITGQASDPGVPRYRPHVAMAESQLDAAGAQERAEWQARFARAKGTTLSATVRGWRKADGSLWRINEVVPCTIPFLRLDADLLVASVAYLLDDKGGRRTELTLGPPDAFTPDPGEVKRHKHKGGKGGGDPWAGVQA